MSNHTPGPWKLMLGHRSGRARGVSGPTGNIVNFHGIARSASSEGQANARLIAAAPDLLEACKAALATHGCETSATCDPGMPTLAEVERMLRAAITKATGLA